MVATLQAFQAECYLWHSDWYAVAMVTGSPEPSIVSKYHCE